MKVKKLKDDMDPYFHSFPLPLLSCTLFLCHALCLNLSCLLELFRHRFGFCQWLGRFYYICHLIVTFVIFSLAACPVLMTCQNIRWYCGLFCCCCCGVCGEDCYVLFEKDFFLSLLSFFFFFFFFFFWMESL